MKVYDIQKSLLLPVNSSGQLFIQDRRGFKEPEWGFFGGGVEEGETPLQAVIRETNEELCLDLSEDDLIDLGISDTNWNGLLIRRYLFLYKTEQEEFDVREGQGGAWLDFTEVRTRLDDKDRFDEIVERIRETLNEHQ